MRAPTLSKKEVKKRWMALCCLVAVLMLWGPVWASAMTSAGMGCCDSGMCLTGGHAAGKHSTPGQKPHESKTSMPSDCGHEGKRAAVGCSMNCCHTEQSAVVPPVVFLLATSVNALLDRTFEPATAILQAPDYRLILDIVSPPPRNIPSIF